MPNVGDRIITVAQVSGITLEMCPIGSIGTIVSTRTTGDRTTIRAEFITGYNWHLLPHEWKVYDGKSLLKVKAIRTLPQEELELGFDYFKDIDIPLEKIRELCEDSEVTCLSNTVRKNGAVWGRLEFTRV